MRTLIGFLVTAVSCCPAAMAGEDDCRGLLDRLQAVGVESKGSREAAEAWQRLAAADAAQLPLILAALDTANPLAANWIRAAVDAIAERELGAGKKLPAKELEQFVLDTRHNPRARRLAYEWLVQADPTATGRLVPGMANDPSLEMRRDAVAGMIEAAAALAAQEKTESAVAEYRRALSSARDFDQVRLLADRLRKMGQKIDLPRHFGFIVRWKVVGPFDNTDEKGYDVAYPPEQKLDFEKAVPGKHGDVKWTDYVAKDDYGKVDLNAGLVEEKQVIGYATSEFLSDQPREVEFRTTSFNAVKLWLNGKLIDKHKVYHSGSQLDQYVCRAALQPGKNTLLVKVCQNAQTQDWARVWGFQLRVCDESGTAVLSR